MGLLSIFQRNKQTAAKPAKSGRAGKPPVRQAPLANSMNPADAAEAVREARARARRRLMGATVLLLIGVIGFPLLFETQPRPIPVDLPIEIPARNAAGVAEVSAPATTHAGAGAAVSATAAASVGGAESVSYDARPASASPVASAPTPAARPSAFAALAAALTPGALRPGDASASSAAPAAAVAASTAASSVAQSRAYINPAMRPGKHPAADAQASAVKPPTIALTPPKPASAAASRPVAAAHASPPPQLPPPTSTTAAPANSGAQAAALLAGNAAPNASDAAAGGSRFVVQIGAFADDVKMRDARGKVEKLGLKTYTQSVDTPGGKRVRLRVGPFPTKAEADRTASKIKGDGLPAAVLVL